MCIPPRRHNCSLPCNRWQRVFLYWLCFNLKSIENNAIIHNKMRRNFNETNRVSDETSNVRGSIGFLIIHRSFKNRIWQAIMHHLELDDDGVILRIVSKFVVRPKNRILFINSPAMRTENIEFSQSPRSMCIRNTFRICV